MADNRGAHDPGGTCCINPGFIIKTLLTCRKIDFVLVYEEDKTESVDNPGFSLDADGGAELPAAPSPTVNQK